MNQTVRAPDCRSSLISHEGCKVEGLVSALIVAKQKAEVISVTGIDRQGPAHDSGRYWGRRGLRPCQVFKYPFLRTWSWPKALQTDQTEQFYCRMSQRLGALNIK